METRVKFWNHGRVTPSTYINIEKQRSLAINVVAEDFVATGAYHTANSFCQAAL